MQDAPKAVWSIPYVSLAFFPSLKHNFIAYRSSKVSSRPDCIFENHQLWQSGFSRVYSNCCCSCWLEAEIIKIGQSSHKMYSNNIVNYQESTTILNGCTKKSGNLLKAPRKYVQRSGNINWKTWYLKTTIVSVIVGSLGMITISKGDINTLPKYLPAVKKSIHGMDWLQKGLWYGATYITIEFLIMYLISNKIIDFITNSMESSWVELTRKEQTQAEVKIPICVFQRDSLSSLLFVRTLMPLNYVLR